jgi:hypothetical protein
MSRQSKAIVKVDPEFIARRNQATPSPPLSLRGAEVLSPAADEAFKT